MHVRLAAGSCPGTPIAESTTTASTPSYVFTGLNAGTYCVGIDPLQGTNVSVLIPGQWTAPSANDGPISQTVTLQAGEQRANVNFGWDYQFQPTTLATPTTVPSHGDAGCSYRATFLGDVTVPDFTTIAAGSPFTKTWRLRNDGSCTWGAGGYALHRIVFVSGNKLGAPDSVEIPLEVRPHSTVEISVPMIAPSAPGIYKSQWRLKVDNGPLVGVGANGRVSLFTVIRVNAAAPTPIPGATRVTFAPGATDAVVDGRLAAGATQDYVLQLGQGQTMMLTLSSQSNQVRVTVAGAQGTGPIVLRNVPGSFWLGQLPVTQDYVIRLTGGTQPSNFSLNITVPQRIQFRPGGTSATLRGQTSARRTVTYLLRASGGQIMTAIVSAPRNRAAALTIFGLDDGQPLVRAVMGSNDWSGVLPRTQDYVIQVVPAVESSLNYTLQVAVE